MPSPSPWLEPQPMFYLWLLIVFLHTMISLKMKLNHGTLELKVISNSFLSHSGQKPPIENLQSPCDCPVLCHHLFDVLSYDHTVHSPSFCHMGLITFLPLRQVCFSLMDIPSVLGCPFLRSPHGLFPNLLLTFTQTSPSLRGLSMTSIHKITA